MPCILNKTAYSSFDKVLYAENAVSLSPFSAERADEMNVILCITESKINKNGQIDAALIRKCINLTLLILL